MRIVRSIALAGLVIAPAVPAAAFAQRAKAGAGGRIAGIAPAPVVVAPVVAPGTFLTSVPVIVSPDGRVFANFGAGFEQVVTACGTSPLVAGSIQPRGTIQPTVVQPAVAQPGIVAGPLPFTPPVPNQQTASQQMLSQGAVPAQAQQQVVVEQRRCWSSDGRGRVFIERQ